MMVIRTLATLPREHTFSSQSDSKDGSIHLPSWKANITCRTYRTSNNGRSCTPTEQMMDLMLSWRLNFILNSQILLSLLSNLTASQSTVTKKGKDVTVNWRLGDEFDSNSTFWTDSNGLEMQERILNYRPTWEYSGEQNISSNYYPVASAIAMRDTATKRQVTVLNERS